ncbi:hypothetical protein GQ651_13585 [Alphaproteobacteria bacterium GH1-50]|uniref:Glycosyl transferase family 2 n=1 Tax=Kangsaoukella pontilimi TaxID=2691042 RepID=A0A7C9ITL6_9RHOB|nr:hypothetical protein [Kangsaoukella pontilimi]MXQ08885.1 hypothetical protein [Kangsaoukella pontilimi]
MRFSALSEAMKDKAVRAAKGPVAVIIAEDDVEVGTTVRHHAFQGFRAIFLVAPPELELSAPVAEMVTRIDHPTRAPDATPTIVNAFARALPEKTWLYYCYNAEYLFYPFAESRTVSEMLAYHAEERRFSMLTYVIDVYAGDLREHDDAVSLEDAHLDRSGYYALARHDAAGEPIDRQLDFFGGLRWRFEEHIDETRRRIDRIAIVRTGAGLVLKADHTWSDPELNTYSCPWHHNLTAAIVSFRTAKALRTNPSSRFEIDTFRWHSSVEFEWHSQQLLDLGLMEPGQWF